VLHIAGFSARAPFPEVDEVNFARRVSTPVLLLSGKFDNIFPLGTHVKPFFSMLGTAAEHKNHVVSDGGHLVPRTQLIRETLDWLARYLGDVVTRPTR
jgi:dipeptidyl aminopeptidase/acylaminoacyl peptidase